MIFSSLFHKLRNKVFSIKTFLLVEMLLELLGFKFLCLYLLVYQVADLLLGDAGLLDLLLKALAVLLEWIELSHLGLVLFDHLEQSSFCFSIWFWEVFDFCHVFLHQLLDWGNFRLATYQVSETVSIFFFEEALNLLFGHLLINSLLQRHQKRSGDHLRLRHVFRSSWSLLLLLLILRWSLSTSSHWLSLLGGWSSLRCWRLSIELSLDGHNDVNELTILGPVHECWPFVVVCSLLDTRVSDSAHNLNLWSNHWEAVVQYPRFKSMIKIHKTILLTLSGREAE